MSRLSEWLAGGLMISDGAWGTQLQARGLSLGTTPDTWNLTHPEQVESVARAYAEAGSQVVLTNTFRANAVAMHDCSAADLDAINRAGVALSKRGAGKQTLVFASIGPTGKVLMSGEVNADQVTAAFAAQAESLAAAGAFFVAPSDRSAKAPTLCRPFRRARLENWMPERKMKDLAQRKDCAEWLYDLKNWRLA